MIKLKGLKASVHADCGHSEAQASVRNDFIHRTGRAGHPCRPPLSPPRTGTGKFLIYGTKILGGDTLQNALRGTEIALESILRGGA